MNQNRREFLTGAAWMGAVAMAAGCMSQKSAMCGLGGGGDSFGGGLVYALAVKKPPQEAIDFSCCRG